MITYICSGLTSIFLNLMVTGLTWNSIIPLCFSGYSLNAVPGTQTASTELVQKNGSYYCKAILTQITGEKIMQRHCNLK